MPAHAISSHMFLSTACRRAAFTREMAGIFSVRREMDLLVLFSSPMGAPC
jgi:hypothetical protein